MTSLASVFKHLKNCKPGSDPEKEAKMLALTWRKASKRFELEHDYSELAARLQEMVQPFDQKKGNLDDHVLKWIAALTFFKEESVKMQIQILERKVKSPDNKIVARVVLPKIEVTDAPFLSESVSDRNQPTLDFSLSKVKIENDRRKSRVKRSIDFEDSDGKKKIRVEQDQIETEHEKEKNEHEGEVVERWVGDKVVETALVSSGKGPLHSTPLTTIDVSKPMRAETTLDLTVITASKQQLGRKTRSSNLTAPQEDQGGKETRSSKLTLSQNPLVAQEELNVPRESKTSNSITHQVNQGREIGKLDEVDKATAAKSILKERVVCNESTESIPLPAEKRVTFFFDEEEEKKRKVTRIERDIQRLHELIKEAERSDVASGEENAAFIWNGKRIVELVHNLELYSNLTGQPNFKPIREKYECGVIAPEYLRVAVEKLVNDTGNAPSFEEVFDIIVANVSQKYKHKELLEHGTSFYEKLMAELKTRRTMFLKESLYPMIKKMHTETGQTAESSDQETKVQIAAVQSEDGKVSRAVQTEMSYFRTYSLGVQTQPDDSEYEERGGGGEHAEPEEEDDLFKDEEDMLGF